jgi:hypothetical protein
MLLFLLGLTVFAAFAQAPTGIILGTVRDESGAVIAAASIAITDKATSAARTVTTNAEGLYTAPALQPGSYEVRATTEGFRTVVREAQVLAGTTTTVDFNLQLGATKEVVNVEGTAAQINYESHAVEGVVQRQSIQELPLNGRSFLQLATLEPGVTTTPGSTGQFNSLFYINTLGGGGQDGPVLTVDGAIINDEMEGGTSMNFSQEVVEEFQISTLNDNLGTGITSDGGINIVTRSGSNDFHASAYFFFRDHNMAAYPGLSFNPFNPHPFFARRNPGFWVGGPIKKDKLFFFFNFEHMNQTTVYTDQQDLASLQPLNSINPSPYISKFISARFDYKLSTKNSLFLRYSHDGNTAFAPYYGNSALPSSWSSNANWADQSIMGITTVLTPALVNDFRFQYHYWQTNALQATSSNCPAPCVGQGLPSLVVVNGGYSGMVGSYTFQAGLNDNSPQLRQTRAFQAIDSLSWLKGPHRFRFGVDYEHMVTKVAPWDYCDPACTGTWSPETTAALAGANTATLFPSLPTSIRSTQDILNLPVFNTTSAIYSGVGAGNGTFPGLYEHDKGGTNQRLQAYATDTWKLKPNFTLNLGIGYIVETGLFYSNLSIPQYLEPILGPNLGPTQINKLDLTPTIGFAWSLGKNKKTVIRGGAGLYWDTQPIWEHFREGSSIGPPGDGRSTLQASLFTNTIPGIFDVTAGKPLAVGAPLPINDLTTMSLGQFMTVVNEELPGIEQRLAPIPPKNGPYSVSGIDIAKTGIEIYPHHYPIMRSYHTSLGVQRDLGHDMVLTVDWARRQYENQLLGELDLNRSTRVINGVPSPVIPFCSASQLYVPGQECSTGAITVWVPQGRVVYDGLLAKLQKRFSNRYQFIASYAFQKQLAEGCTTCASGVLPNMDNYFASYGPILARHNLNIAGVVNLPWGFRISVNSSIISRTPQEPVIYGIDLNGSGNFAFPLTEAVPRGTLPYGCLGFSCGKSDLTKAISYFNTTWAGKKDADGNTIPTLALPTDYQIGDPLFTQDIRVTKELTIKEKYRFSVFGEFFNAFNIANLQGYSFALDSLAPGCTLSGNNVNTSCSSQSFAFGQPTARLSNVFGSGGPRAIQVGGRFQF